MTHTEASKKFCPFMMKKTVSEPLNCKGIQCMMWKGTASAGYCAIAEREDFKQKA